MLLDITLKNYRCFPDTDPVRFSIRKGFTAFLGSNNSGKSSLLKFFVEFRGLFSLITGDFPAAMTGRPLPFQLTGVPDISEVFSNTNNRNIVIEFGFTPDSEDDPAQLPTTPRNIRLEVLRDQNILLVTNLSLPSGAVTLSGSFAITQDRELLTQGGGAKVAYLGPLIRALMSCANGVYLGAFRNTINVGGSSSYYDIQVGEQFSRTWKGFKAGVLKRRSDGAYRLTQDIRHIFDFTNLEILNSEDDKSLNVFVDGRSFRLDEVGSGLSQFMLVLATVAVRQQDFIFIDEPETSLHPSLQIDFLTTLGSYANQGVLFGTHSIGLARAIGQQIYAVKRIRQGESQVRPLTSESAKANAPVATHPLCATSPTTSRSPPSLPACSTRSVRSRDKHTLRGTTRPIEGKSSSGRNEHSEFSSFMSRQSFLASSSRPFRMPMRQPEVIKDFESFSRIPTVESLADTGLNSVGSDSLTGLPWRCQPCLPSTLRSIPPLEFVYRSELRDHPCSRHLGSGFPMAQGGVTA